MKVLKLYSLLLLLFLSSSACEKYVYLKTDFADNLNAYFYYPSECNKHDTTISFSKEQLVPIHLTLNANGHYEGGIAIGMGTIDSWFTKYWKTDTVSFFLFDKELIDGVSWDRVVEEYLVLQRYDMTSSDLKRVNCCFYYPPTAIMKDMHMWPPYGQAVVMCVD